MAQAQQKLYGGKGSRGQTHITNLRKSNWTEVMAEIEATAQKWKASSEKQGKIMIFIDKVGRNSSALQSWLSLLPMGDYGSRYIHSILPLVIHSKDI